MKDYALGTTFDVKFTTRSFSTGVPFTLAGSPVISAYPDNSTTQLTAGITLTVDFDSVTGLNNVRMVATSGNGYASGSNYTLVITTGTVNSVSVVGECVGEFSLEAQSPLRPTTAGRTLDVSATGEGGVDWANVGSPTTTLDLSGTTIKTTQKVDVDTIKTNPVVNGGTITFPTTATLASTTNITAGTITTVGTLTTYTGNTVQTGDSFARIGAAGASLSAIPNMSNLDATVSSRATPAQILTTALTEAYAADGAAPTVSQALFLLIAALTEFSISSTTITVKKLDGSTTAATYTLDDAANPTSRTRAS